MRFSEKNVSKELDTWR